MEVLARTRKLGGSIIVTIPKEIVKEQGIQEDELIEIQVKKRKKDYFGALKGIGSFTKEDELKGHFEDEE